MIYEYVEHYFKDRCGFLHDLGVLASSGRLLGIRAWSVIGYANGVRTSIPRCMEPPVLFDHCFFGGRDVELEEQRLGLLDQLRYPRDRGYRLNLLRACSRSRLCARLACHSGPRISVAGDDLLDNRPTDVTKGATPSLTGNDMCIRGVWAWHALFRLVKPGFQYLIATQSVL